MQCLGSCGKESRHHGTPRAHATLKKKVQEYTGNFGSGSGLKATVVSLADSNCCSNSCIRVARQGIILHKLILEIIQEDDRGESKSWARCAKVTC